MSLNDDVRSPSTSVSGGSDLDDRELLLLLVLLLLDLARAAATRPDSGGELVGADLGGCCVVTMGIILDTR